MLLEKQIALSVEKWVKSSNNPEQIEKIKEFIDKSIVSYATKQKLYAIADGRKYVQENKPYFKIVDGIAYYSDNDFNIKDFSTRFQAVCALFRLVMAGHDVYLMETSDGYNIVMEHQKKEVSHA